MDCHFLLQGSSPPRDQTQVSWAPAMASKFFTTESAGNHTPIFFLLDPLFLRAIKGPRDVATHTEYTTVKTCTGVCFLGIPKALPHNNNKGNTRMCRKDEGLGSRNEKYNNHSSLIKHKGSTPPSLSSQLPDGGEGNGTPLQYLGKSHGWRAW